MDRQLNGELAAVAHPANGHRHKAAVQLDELLHQRQAEPQAAARTVERLRFLYEQLENAVAQLASDAFAGIAHTEQRVVVDRVDDAAHRERRGDVGHGVPFGEWPSDGTDSGGEGSARR